MKTNFKSPWISIVLGIAAIGFTAFTYFQKDKFLDKAMDAKGIVVDVYAKEPSLSDKNDGEYQTEYCPVIAFTTAAGDSVRFKSGTGSYYFDTYKVGKEVDVIYDPENPADASIKTSKEANKWQSMMFGGSGLLMIGIGIFGVIKRKRLSMPM